MIPSRQEILSRAGEIQPALLPLEERRLSVIKSAKYAFVALLASLVAYLTLVILFKLSYYHFAIAGGITTLLITWIYRRFFTDEQLAIDFKDTLFKEALPLMLPFSVMFEPQRHIPLNYLQESELFLHFPSSLNGGNAVKAQKELTFLYSEVEAYVGSPDNEFCIFDGMFYIFQTIKEYKPSIQIIPNHFDKKITTIGRKIVEQSSFRGKAGRLFDEYFDEKFLVFCQDILYARQIINQEIRQALLNFHQNTGASIYMSFKGKKIYIGLHNCPPVSFSISKPCTSLEYLEEVVNKFVFPIRLVLEINQKQKEKEMAPKEQPNWDI